MLLHTVACILKVTACSKVTVKGKFMGRWSERAHMASKSEKEYRAILTEREKEILTGDADVSDSYYYRVVSRVRDKIECLENDLEVLDGHHSGLATELREIVCGENL